MGAVAARGRKRKTPPAAQVARLAGGSVVGTAEPPVRHPLGAERRHLIRGVNRPVISLRLRGDGVTVGFPFPLPLYFLKIV